MWRRGGPQASDEIATRHDVGTPQQFRRETDEIIERASVLLDELKDHLDEQELLISGKARRERRD